MKLGWLLPVVLALLAYGGSLGGGFVYDDAPSIVQNDAILRGDWWHAAFAPPHTPISNRPLPCAMFALEHRLAAGAALHRQVNLALHVLNALLVLLVAQRCCLAPNLRVAPTSSNRIAAAAAALFACHPLCTDAVAYVTQRTTLLMTAAFLSTLWCTLRAATSPHRWRWQTAAVVALWLGVCSKEELAAAPVLVALFLRAFVWPSWRDVARQWRFLLALASCWLPLAVCVWLGPHNPTVGYDCIVRVSAREWLQTQAAVVLHYARLCVWPHPLRPAYDWPIVRDLGAALLPGLIVLAALGAGVWLWRRWPHWGWLAVLFFLLLAPTSTVLPIITEVAAERRAYLPLLAAVVPLAVGWDRLWQRARTNGARIALASATVALLAACVLATRSAATSYADDAAFWTAAYERNELTSGSLVAASILAGQGRVLREQGRLDEAYALFDRSMQGEVQLDSVRANFVLSLIERNRLDDAERHARALVRDRNDLGMALALLAEALWRQCERDARDGVVSPNDPRLVEAEPLAQRAVALAPMPRHVNTLAMVLARRQQFAAAERLLRQLLAQAPDYRLTHSNLGLVLLLAGRPAEAAQVYLPLLPGAPRDVSLRMNLATALLQSGDRAGAAAVLQEVLQLQPGFAPAREMLDDLRR